MIKILSTSDPLRGLDYCLGQVATLQREWRQRRAFVIVPEEAKADTERRYLEHFDSQGLMMAEVLSFRRLAHRLFSEIGGLALRRLGDNGKALLICRLLQLEKEDFPVLGRLAGKGDYAAELSQILGDFSRYQVAAESLEEVVEEAKDLPQLTRSKVKDLARLKRCFDGAKKDLGWVDSDEDFPRLSRLLEEEKDHPRLAFLQDASIFVAGFTLLRAFTPQEMGLLRALSRRVKNLEIVVCDRKVDGEIFAQEGLEIGQLSRKELEKNFPEAERIILDVEAEPKTSASRIECWRSENAEEEAAACAGEIRLLLQRENLRRRDIAIAYCREEDRDRLGVQLRDYGIDPYILPARPLDESPLLRYLEAFFRIAGGKGLPRDLIALGRSGLTEAPREFWDRFDNFLAASGCRYINQLEDERFYQRRPEEGEFAKAFFEQYLRPHLLAGERLRKKRSGGEKAGLMLTYLDEEGIREHLEALQAELLNSEGEKEGLEEAQFLAIAWNQVMEVLDEAKELLGESQISAADFGELILSTLRQQIPAAIPLGIDRVRVGRPAQLLLYPAKVLFILGADVNSFPPPAPAEGLLQNVERQWLEDKGEIRLPNYRRDNIPSGQALVRHLSQAPSELLIISCPSLEDWKLSAPQVELEEKGVIQRRFEDPASPDNRWLSAQRAARYLRHMDQLGKKNLALEAWKDLLNSLAVKEDIQKEAQDPLDVMGKARIILPAELLEQNRATKSISISRLQSFGECPYQHFAQYGLRLEERQVFRPDALNRGTFLHAMMEDAMADLSKAWQEKELPFAERLHALEAWYQGLDERYVNEIYLRSAEREGLNRFASAELRGGEGRRMRRMLQDMLRFNAKSMFEEGFVPEKLEWRFPSLDSKRGDLLLADGKYRFRGVIDRVDRNEEGLVRILDYKSGNTSFDFAKLICGTQLQLPLYEKIWLHEHPEAEVDSLLYQKLSEDERKLLLSARREVKKSYEERSKPLKKDDLAAGVADYALALSEKLLRRMDEGEISATPLKLNSVPCDYCAYGDICRDDSRLRQARERRPNLDRGKHKRADNCKIILAEWRDSGDFPEEV